MSNVQLNSENRFPINPQPNHQTSHHHSLYQNAEQIRSSPTLSPELAHLKDTAENLNRNQTNVISLTTDGTLEEPFTDDVLYDTLLSEEQKNQLTNNNDSLSLKHDIVFTAKKFKKICEELPNLELIDQEESINSTHQIQSDDILSSSNTIENEVIIHVTEPLTQFKDLTPEELEDCLFEPLSEKFDNKLISDKSNSPSEQEQKNQLTNNNEGLYYRNDTTHHLKDNNNNLAFNLENNNDSLSLEHDIVFTAKKFKKICEELPNLELIDQAHNIQEKNYASSHKRQYPFTNTNNTVPPTKKPAFFLESCIYSTPQVQSTDDISLTSNTSAYIQDYPQPQNQSINAEKCYLFDKMPESVKKNFWYLLNGEQQKTVASNIDICNIYLTALMHSCSFDVKGILNKEKIIFIKNWYIRIKRTNYYTLQTTHEQYILPSQWIFQYLQNYRDTGLINSLKDRIIFTPKEYLTPYQIRQIEKIITNIQQAITNTTISYITEQKLVNSIATTSKQDSKMLQFKFLLDSPVNSKKHSMLPTLSNNTHTPNNTLAVESQNQTMNTIFSDEHALDKMTDQTLKHDIIELLTRHFTLLKDFNQPIDNKKFYKLGTFFPNYQQAGVVYYLLDNVPFEIIKQQISNQSSVVLIIKDKTKVKSIQDQLRKESNRVYDLVISKEDIVKLHLSYDSNNKNILELWFNEQCNNTSLTTQKSRFPDIAKIEFKNITFTAPTKDLINYQYQINGTHIKGWIEYELFIAEVNQPTKIIFARNNWYYLQKIITNDTTAIVGMTQLAMQRYKNKVKRDLPHYLGLYSFLVPDENPIRFANQTETIKIFKKFDNISKGRLKKNSFRSST